MFRAIASLVIAFGMFAAAYAAQDKSEKKDQKDDEQGFKSLMDGKTFKGWKPTKENAETWKIEDGAFVAKGDRSHLFYVGDEKPFKNFELKVDVMTEPNSNGGIYFHTRYQESDWPQMGYEVQVNNTHPDPRKTGSIYAVKDVMNNSPAKDNEWFTEHIIVKDKTITVKVDGKTVAEFTEEPGRKAGKQFGRKLNEGTFALQAHDPKSVVRYKNIRVKRLD
jgi:hypothetical protein